MTHIENAIQLLDVVALTGGLPERGLLRGQVGTVVEKLSANAFEVEFSNERGQSYAQLAVDESQLLVLHYHSPQAA
jgi:hypothetical protein